MFTFLLNTGSLDVVYVFVIATTIEHRSYDIKPSVIVIIISTLITLNFESPSLSGSSPIAGEYPKPYGSEKLLSLKEQFQRKLPERINALQLIKNADAF
ncbi:hypothetical protein F2Q69_00037305 [Brassica cretica]|uniref:Uncharacterized protein n=1 Tax=Brassica cretica TaxID=69181 RepID=A0A8S9SFP3_BRACR|nr:hypothetical protein F2Q69_00037305 [Brassica cretica]